MKQLRGLLLRKEGETSGHIALELKDDLKTKEDDAAMSF